LSLIGQDQYAQPRKKDELLVRLFFVQGKQLKPSADFCKAKRLGGSVDGTQDKIITRDTYALGHKSRV